MRVVSISIALIATMIVTSCSTNTHNTKDFQKLNEKITELNKQQEELQSKLEKSEKRLNVLQSKMVKQTDIAGIKDDTTYIKSMVENLEGIYIPEEEARQIAESLTSNEVEKWAVTFNENYDYDESNEHNLVRDVWVVKAFHSLGNKTIYYIDAITKEVVNISEIESNH
ncbi:hypothetical protein [Pontibacillus sp. HMF3514]|uniref:hypothetical protein n=1 Tax=Pontibacillus sp. HMF3514 TaxID=2692425 RepID=UPI00131FDAA7|nr:hypothetical protein [Pontibacillus sp. HMF3514]QHE52718.1 hypothetical protein GS400_12050 [Pontibacillus sp. HMF3514]